MTKEEIKAQYTMADVVEQFGIEINRNHKCTCPFHSGDNTPSLHVYDDSFYCFACGAHGDIFAFVMQMNNCGFKEAFEFLGGTSEKISDAALLKIDRIRKEREVRQRILDEKEQAYRFALKEVALFYGAAAQAEPLSDLWCDAMNFAIIADYKADIALQELWEAREYKKKGNSK